MRIISYIAIGLFAGFVAFETMNVWTQINNDHVVLMSIVKLINDANQQVKGGQVNAPAASPTPINHR